MEIVFNSFACISRAAEDVVMYSPDCVPVTSESIDNAINWLWNLDRLAAVSRTATTEALVKAMEDPNVSMSTPANVSTQFLIYTVNHEFFLALKFANLSVFESAPIKFRLCY
jgi:hypothetical protein